ncbi:hypothetical protein [Rhizobium halophilum]|nr:hypothetical protein [Rhizobium halophilum]
MATRFRQMTAAAPWRMRLARNWRREGFHRTVEAAAQAVQSR